MSQSTQCETCKHYWGAHHCDAFPEGIPVKIMQGEIDHSKPVPGDNGIQYERNEDYNLDEEEP